MASLISAFHISGFYVFHIIFKFISATDNVSYEIKGKTQGMQCVISGFCSLIIQKIIRSSIFQLMTTIKQ